MIGGNVTGIVQRKLDGVKNEIGETVETWENAYELIGFLDLMNGDSNLTYNAYIQDSTHVFVTSYITLNNVISDRSRMIINGKAYTVKYIDDPMELHKHLEIFLKCIGGGLNG